MDRVPAQRKLQTGLAICLLAGGGAVVAIALLVKSMADAYAAAKHRWESGENLRMIALAAHNYIDDWKRLPAGGTLDACGEPLHSWETALTPYLEEPVKPDLGLSWHDPRNSETFCTPIARFVNPAFQARFDGQGYALSHYAANAHVMWNNSKVRCEDIADGFSYTLLFGEVGEGFRPWGDPVNSRDPAVGINRPGGFGGPPGQGGVQFALLDGSVRFIAQDTDPEVLRALATPAGGDGEIAKRGLP